MLMELAAGRKGTAGGTNPIGKALTTVVSYPDRDPEDNKYGDPGWRGNCSGLFFRDVLLWYWQHHFRGRSIRVADPMSGSGTTGDVCTELGLEWDGYDLNPAPRRGLGGWNARRDEFGRAVDFVFVHPPYWNIIQYSRTQWKNRTPNPDDLSEITDYYEFIQALNECHLRMFSDLRLGGIMALLVGDVKSKGQLYSMQRDLAWLGTPKQIVIKTQHNCSSDKIAYKSKAFIPIRHEYLLVFERRPGMTTSIKRSVTIDYDLTSWEQATWKSLVRWAMEQLGGSAHLSALYKKLGKTKKAQKNPTYDATIRRTLQECPDFTACGDGVWRLVA